MRRIRKVVTASFIFTASVSLVALTMSAPAGATIPDANIVDGVNRGGFGVITGVYGQADFPISGEAAVGAYFGFDPDDVYFDDFDNDDDVFDDDFVVGGHYMHQFLEGSSDEPHIAGLLGLYANRRGVRPEVGFALSYAFDRKWTGRANIVYGPSWGLEAGYRFSPTLEGTIGITGMGLLGLGFRF